MFNLKWLTNTPIFRRLFIAFAMAAVIPGIIISVLGSTYISALTARGQAEQTSHEAMKIATDQLGNIRQMNADLIAFHSTAFANRGEYDPSMAAMEQNLNKEIVALQGKFALQALQYQQDYQIATSPQMAGIQRILSGVDPSNQIALDQQQTLTKVLGRGQEWA